MPGIEFAKLGAAVEEAAQEAAAPKPGSPEKAAELPAFLEKDESGEYILPEGYELAELKQGEKVALELDQKAGSRMMFYLGNVGFIAERGEKGEVYVRLAGMSFPNKIWYETVFLGNVKKGEEMRLDPRGVQVGSVGGVRRRLSINKRFSSGGELNIYASNNLRQSSGPDYIHLGLPDLVHNGEGSVRVSNFGAYSPGLYLDNDGNILVENSLYNNGRLKIAVPRAAEKAELPPVAEVSAQQRMAGAIGELAELDKNREASDLSRKAGLALVQLLTAMGEAEPELIEKVARSGLGKKKNEPISNEEKITFFGELVQAAMEMKPEITEPAQNARESLSTSINALMDLNEASDSTDRRRLAGEALGRFLTELSRVNQETRNKLVAKGLNKKADELTSQDLLIFFGRVMGTAVAMKAKLK